MKESAEREGDFAAAPFLTLADKDSANVINTCATAMQVQVTLS